VCGKGDGEIEKETTGRKQRRKGSILSKSFQTKNAQYFSSKKLADVFDLLDGV
jgi:hypothetical protein